MKILVINAGSSSLKYQLIDMDNEQVMAKGLCERIGIEGSNLQHTNVAKNEKTKIEKPMKDHGDAIQMVIDALVDEKIGVIKSMDEIGAVGHRVVHGGEEFAGSCVITEAVMKALEKCTPLAPLHNPPNIIGIKACQKIMPNTPMVGVFDTTFHQTMPPKAYLYGIPKKYYEQYGIRRYGFHGTSHSFVSERLAQLAGLDINNSKMIICHIGSGASISAVVNGKSVDTSMGMTPLEGLVMGTRSGDIDPAIVEFICNKENKSVSDVLTMLNKESGVLGISGLSNDYRDLLEEEDAGNEAAHNALEVLVYRVIKYIGAYHTAIGGADAIALTAGAGENNLVVRGRIVEGLSALGIKLNKEANTVRGEELLLSTADSSIPVWVVPTNEELKIARETAAVVEK